MADQDARGGGGEHRDIDSGQQGGASGSPDFLEALDFSESSLADVDRGDQWLDALAHGGAPTTGDPDMDELAELLLRWRADILAAPMPQGPSLDEVEAAVLAQAAAARPVSARPGSVPAGRGATRRPRLLTSIASAAAAAAVVFGGVGILSQNAQPGDALWGVRQAIFGQEPSTIAVTIAGIASELDEVQRLLDTDEATNVVRAQQLLAEVQAKLPQVSSWEEPAADLSQRYEALTTQLYHHPAVVAGEVTIAPSTTVPTGQSVADTTPATTVDATATATPGAGGTTGAGVPTTTTADVPTPTPDPTPPTGESTVPVVPTSAEVPTSTGAAGATTTPAASSETTAASSEPETAELSEGAQPLGLRGGGQEPSGLKATAKAGS